ncbi:MAG: pyridoxal-phosphate dependent enzyme [Bdellovibrionota bacterium]
MTIELQEQRIVEARERIAPYIRHTPLAPVRKLSSRLPDRLILKLENLQVSGSFKARGVFNHLLSADPKDLSAGIIVASGGNHGLAAAYAGWKLNIPVTVCLPSTATQDRRERIAAFNAKLLYSGNNPSDVLRFAAERARAEGLMPIHPFDAVKTLEGTGTLGLEMVDDVPDIDCALIAIGGGGLIGGAAYALKQRRPEMRIIGVEPVGAASMWASLQAGRLVELPKTSTIADTLAPREVCERTLSLAKDFVDEVVLVSDAQMIDAMQLLWVEYNQLVEPAGAAVLAAVLGDFVDLTPYKNPVALICGGNASAKTVFEEYSARASKDTPYIPGCVFSKPR